MKTYFADLIPKIKRFSKKLDDLTLLTNQHWVSLCDISNNKTNPKYPSDGVDAQDIVLKTNFALRGGVRPCRQGIEVFPVVWQQLGYSGDGCSAIRMSTSFNQS